jgi:hypothetical protein
MSPVRAQVLQLPSSGSTPATASGRNRPSPVASMFTWRRTGSPSPGGPRRRSGRGAGRARPVDRRIRPRRRAQRPGGPCSPGAGRRGATWRRGPQDLRRRPPGPGSRPVVPSPAATAVADALGGDSLRDGDERDLAGDRPDAVHRRRRSARARHRDRAEPERLRREDARSREPVRVTIPWPAGGRSGSGGTCGGGSWGSRGRPRRTPARSAPRPRRRSARPAERRRSPPPLVARGPAGLVRWVGSRSRCRSSSSRKSRSRGARPMEVEVVRPAAALSRRPGDGRPPSKPVAMTVIITSSPSRSSKLVPKMMFASGSAAARISSAASVTSYRREVRGRR